MRALIDTCHPGRGVVRELDDVEDLLDGAPLADPGEPDLELIRKISLPYKLIRAYSRLRVEGLENIPSGPAILAANHTGWLGLDYTNLAITIHDHLGRVPRGVVHDLWFARPKIADIARRLGLVPARKATMERLLEEGKLVVVFPEAEQGAFKPTVDRQYKLQEFRRGFVRVALASGAPIIPVAILGGEEASPVLRRLALTDKLFRLPIPVPQNLLPRPVKWRISILPPYPMGRYKKGDAERREVVHRIANNVRLRIQKELKVQKAKRGHPYV